MGNTRWEVWTIARWFSDRKLVFESIKGKHLYHTGSGNNSMLNPQYEEKIQVIGILFLYKEPELSDLKLQEALFFVSNFSYFIFCFTKNQHFQTYLCFLLNLNLKRKSTNSVFQLISVVIWKPIPVKDPRATMLC